MTQLLRQQVEEMLKNKPEGVSDQSVMQSLVNRGYEIEGLNLPSRAKQAPNTIERVGDAITGAGERIQAQISGEGEFAGQSDVTRGLGAAATAATAIPDVALQSVPEPLGGGALRSGVERVGNTIGRGFDWLTDKVASTKLFSDIGRLEASGAINPEDNPEFYALRDTLQGTASAGEIAEVTAGAGVGPQAAVNLARRTGEATADVSREMFDRTVRATGNLTNRATPQSVRTLLRSNEPETQQQAVNQLEDAYNSALVEDRKSINNKLEKLAAGESFGDVRVTRDDLITEIAREGYIPRIEGQFAKFDEVFEDIETRQRDIMQQLDNELEPYNNRVEAQTSLDRLRLEAEAALRQSPQIGAGLTSSLRELNRMFESFAEKYGQTVTPVDVNNIRKEMNRVSKAYKDEDIFKLDTSEAVAKATRNRLDEVVPDQKIKQLNQEWARLNRVAQTAGVLHNETVEVGLLGRKLGSYVGTIGASLAGLQLAGAGGLVVASIFAQLGSDALARILRERTFNPKLRERIINELNADEVTREKVIREASPENKKFLRNLLATGGAIAGADFFLSEENADAAAAVLVGSTGTRTPITGKALDRVKQYIDWSEGINEVKGQALIDLKADAQLIAERANLDSDMLTAGDKQLANGLRAALDTQLANRKN